MGEIQKAVMLLGFAHYMLYPCLLIQANPSKDLLQDVAYDDYAPGRHYLTYLPRKLFLAYQAANLP